MTIRGISIFATVALVCAAAGCAHSASPAAAPATAGSPAVAADPATALIATLKPLQRQNYAFSMTAPGLTAKGFVDQDAASVHVVTVWDGGKETDTADVVALGASRYLRLGVKSKDYDRAKTDSDPAVRKATRLLDGETWLKLDPKRLKSDSLDPYLTDVTGIIAVVHDAVADSGTGQQLSGHIDLPPSIPPRHGLLAPRTIQLQSFTATLDPQGELLTLRPAAKPGNWGFAFSGYGAQQRPTAPAGAQTLPSSMYQYIND